MRVLCHLSTFVSIKEDIVDVERSSYERLLVSLGDTDRSTGGIQFTGSPQALADGSDVEVDLDFVILYESLIPLLSKYLRREPMVPLRLFISLQVCERSSRNKAGLDYILRNHCV